MHFAHCLHTWSSRDKGEELILRLSYKSNSVKLKLQGVWEGEVELNKNALCESELSNSSW